MGNTQKLSTTEGIKKIQELATDANVCLFVTNLSSTPLSARPMSTLDVDDEGNVWFFSRDKSDKNTDIANDNRVQLFYSNNSSSEYLSIYGEAEITTDKEKIKALWTPIAKAWFTEGEDDPSITAIKVKPIDAYYWDTKNNKLISVIQIAISTLTGKTMDGGIEGEIKL
ncbi:pyridoxamine 5'-phosphate oxidase family protein [Parasediminibacterium sp. JCM 36343]|uniref:pyridoxamine 5'-phosphate oxidase family protein n=1 Tax=Parasediminibacterium sp. JCM 36343 TaxID=3374279 RepID=UPI00397CE924